MRTEQLDYDLPEHLIAQHPAQRRDASRLMVLDRAPRRVAHHTFANLPELLQPGDLLVLNDTRVLPARLLGRRLRTGGKWEGLYLQSDDHGDWELLCQSRGRLEIGEEVEADGLRLTLIGRRGGHWLARPAANGSALDLLARHGHVPLPPYIRKGRAVADDRERYQTVYAGPPGSVAAPTAGLHFTPELLAQLEERGVERAFVTLHVGAGTFQPIKAEQVSEHLMHAEWGTLPPATVEAVTRCRARGGRIVAVGTTTVRVLETAAEEGLRPWTGQTTLFIRPPHVFRAIDALVTNFHLPRSSLLLLVGAFAGLDWLLEVYRQAIALDYRFYSYGDAMLIL